MRLFFYLLVVLLVVGCGHNFVDKQIRPDHLSFPALEFSFPAVVQQQLANGIKLYLQEDHELPLVELTLMIEGGSIHDSLKKTGLSQLFAETLGTGGAGELSPAELEAELEAMAAKMSVSSSSYCYEVDLSLHRRDLQRGIEILADMLRRPRFDAKRVELARKQLLESIHRKNDDPGSIAGRLLAEAVNPGHPFGQYPTAEQVAGLTREDLLELHQRYFQPEHCWLAVSGDVQQAELVALLEQQFGDWSSVENLIHDFPQLPQAPEGRIFLVDKELSQTTIMMGHRGINKDNPDVSALRVANYILGGGGFNSRLMREIRSNRGLAYSIYSYFQIGRHLPQLFIAASETKCGSTAEVVVLMWQLMQQMIDEPVSAAELDLAKKSLINSFVFAFENSHSVVSRKARLDFYDYPEDYLETYRQRIAAVTVEDVQRVARQYLHPQQLQIVLVGHSELYADAVSKLGLPVEKIDLKQTQ